MPRRRNYAPFTNGRSVEPLTGEAIPLLDPDLTRQIRSIARSCTSKNPARVEEVASKVLRLAVVAGIDRVREDLATTVTRSHPIHQEDE